MAINNRPQITRINDVNQDQRHMEDRRHLCRTLMDGTWAMRALGEKYLPKEPAEKRHSYQRRLDRTILKNYFKKTVKSLVGRVFVKPLIVTSKSELVNKFIEDIDLQGNHINVYGKLLMDKAMVDGITFTYVDMPRRPVNPETGLPVTITLEDVQNGGFRPYFIHVTADRIIDWKASSAPGEPFLTSIRFWENLAIDDGEFGSTILERIRVLKMIQVTDDLGNTVWRQQFRVYEKVPANTMMVVNYGQGPSQDPTAGYALVDEGITSADHITFHPFYADRVKFMVAYPALEDLAYLNLAHWQSYSDQRNILHVIRVPILFGTGFEKDEDGNWDVSLEVGANLAIYADRDAKLTYVEHQGASAAAGQKDLEELQAEMVTFGLEFMMSRPSHESASARILDQTEVNSPLKAVADNLTDHLENALLTFVKYLDEEEEPEVKTQGELGLSLKDSASLSNLITARAAGDISLVTFLTELQRMGLLADDLKIDEEVARVKAEKTEATAQALAIASAAPATPPGDNDDNEDPDGGDSQERQGPNPPTPPPAG